MSTLLQINTVVNTGSTGRIAEGIGLQAMREGWDCYIAYGRYGNESCSHVIKIGTELGNYQNVIRTRLTDRHGLASKKATKIFIDQIKKIKPTLIHLHNIHGYYLNYEIFFYFLKKYKVPVLWTLHDCWPFTGHCAYFEYANCDKWKSQCHHCPETHSYPKSYYDNSKANFLRKKIAFNEVDNLTVVSVSKWLEEQVKKSFLSEYSSRQIYNGIDLEQFIQVNSSEVREKYHLDHKVVCLGVASTWDRRKGLKDFIALSKILSDDYRVVLVGLSKRQIKRLPTNIIGIERTESIEEMVGLYNLAGVFLNPTWEDNFPTTNIEALACGTPVVTYDTGGSPEAVDSETGFVVPKGDVRGLKETIELVHSKGKAFYTEKCRARAERYFDKDERFGEYIDLYEELLARGR